MPTEKTGQEQQHRDKPRLLGWLGLTRMTGNPVADGVSHSSHLRKPTEEQFAQLQQDLARSKEEVALLQTQLAQSETRAQHLGKERAKANQELAELARLMEESKQSSALLKSTIDSLPQGIFCKEINGAYAFANKAFRETLNVPFDDVAGRTETDFFSLDAATANLAYDKKALETAETLESLLIDDFGGKKLYAQMTRAPRYDSDGNIAGTAGIFWEVADNTRVEEALARERDLLNALMDSSTDVIYFKDRESRFLRINKAHAALFGLSDPAEAVGKRDFDFFTVEHAQAAYDDEQRIIQTGTPLVGVEERETWPDKEDTWASTTKHPLFDRNGQIIGTFGITRDITERKRAAEALDRSLAAFEAFVSQVSEGNLTVRSREGDDTLGRVSQSINKMLVSFSAMITGVKSLGLSLSASANQMLAAAEEIAKGSQEQTNETSNVTSSVEEMAASMEQVSKNAEASAEAARQALEKADKGTQSVRDTSEAMIKINDAVGRTADKMRLLAQRSSEITEIMGLINGIAAQTNLLALNAAIEAAHAGEAGLGFSVVAEEIRKLADKSVQATRDVGELIKGIQSETAAAISAMENGMKEVKDGLVLAEHSRQALLDIASGLERSTELAEEISVASEQQTRVTLNLAAAMQTISSITMQASAAAHETTQIINGMVDLSEKLNQSISQFKVRDGLT